MKSSTSGGAHRPFLMRSIIAAIKSAMQEMSTAASNKNGLATHSQSARKYANGLLVREVKRFALVMPCLLLTGHAVAAVTCGPSGGNLPLAGGNTGPANYFCTGVGKIDLTLDTNSAVNVENDVLVVNESTHQNYPGATSIGTLTISGNRSGGWIGVQTQAMKAGDPTPSIEKLVVTSNLQARFVAIYNQGSISRIENSGTISSAGAIMGASPAIQNVYGNIGTILNTGTIISTNAGFGIQNFYGVIDTLDNETGTIAVNGGAGYAIKNQYNFGNQGIHRLINGQGGNVAALTYTGNLPRNYLLALGNDATRYGQLSAGGQVLPSASGILMNFGIYSGSVKSNAYTSVLSGIDGSLITGTTKSGTYDGLSWVLSERAPGIWDLLFPNWTAMNYVMATTNLKNNPAAGAAAVLDANSHLSNAFSVNSQAQYNNAATQTLPLLTGGSIVAASSAFTGINRVVQARIEANRGLSAGDDFQGDGRMWMKPFGSWANQGDVNGVAGFKANTYGFAAGLDSTVSSQLRLGAAIAYANSSIDSKSSIAPQHSNVNVYQLIGYGSYSLNDTTEVSFQADVGQNKNKGNRTIALAGTVASSAYDSISAHAGVGIGKVYKFAEKSSVTPSVRIDYTWVQDEAYTETGANVLNLIVGKRSTDMLVLSTEGKFTHELSAGTTLTANVGVGYDTLNKQAAITSVFAGAPGASFVTYGLQQDPWIGRLGVGLVHKTKSGLEVSARYDAESRTSFLNQTASLKFRWNF